MSKDRDYIKAMFDSDGIRAPESLYEENMLLRKRNPSSRLNGSLQSRQAKTRPQKSASRGTHM